MKTWFTSDWLVGLMMAVALPAAVQQPVRLYAAGSLRVALTRIARTFEKQEGIRATTERRRTSPGLPG